MNIGDVNSKERGSGARFSEGKVRLDYVPAAVLFNHYAIEAGKGDVIDRAATLDVLYYASKFESRDGGIEELNHALNTVLRDGGGVDRWRDVCAVLDKGAVKYAPWNWAKGMAWSIPLGCIKRHAVKILEGETLDDESGESHFGHIGANLVMLLHYLSHYPEGDDRPPAQCFAPQGIVAGFDGYQFYSEPGEIIPQKFPGQVIVSPETGDVIEVDSSYVDSQKPRC